MTDWIINTTDNASILAGFAVNAPSDLNTINVGDTATYTFGDVRTRLTVESGETYTVPADTTEQWDIVVVRGTLDVDGRINIDELDIDGGTIDADTTPYDLGGYTVPEGETEYFSPAIVPAGETLTIEGTLETQDITINGNVAGDGDLNIQDFNRPPSNGTVAVNEKYALEFTEAQKYSPYTGKFTTFETLNSSQPYREFLPSTAQINTLLVGIEPGESLQNKDIEGYWGLISNITDERTQALSNIRIGFEIQVLAPFDEYSDHTAVQSDLEV